MGKLKTYFSCDSCGEAEYTPNNPFVEARTPRPSNPKEICCVLAGHKNCIRCAELATGVDGGIATPEMWTTFIESPKAKEAGLFLG